MSVCDVRSTCCCPILVALVFGFALYVQPTGGAQVLEGRPCGIQITAPRLGDNVGATEPVRGVAGDIGGKFLWVLAHRVGLALLWPQGGGPAAVSAGGHWEVVTSFGTDADIGRDFEVVAVVVDSQENAKILKYVQKTLETGQYPGMPMPTVDRVCGIQHVTVTRSN